jgi:FkbM family methyltransferase
MHSIVAPWGEDDPISARIRGGEFDECRTLAHWLFAIDMAPENARVLDVGSFVGLFSLVAAARRSDMMSIAFEPSAVTFGRLCYNIQLNLFNRKVVPVHLAVWNKKEVVNLKHKYGIFTLCPGESIVRGTEFDHTETVLSIPLDSILELPYPDYLNSCSRMIHDRPIVAVKIDVEGVEPQVIEGAHKLIDSHRPMFICEALSRVAENRLRDIFDRLNYHAKKMENERNLVFVAAEKKEDFEEQFEKWGMVNGKEALVTGDSVATNWI